MAAASVSVKQLDEVTECPICNELFTDPRFLPCIHTYCFRCIEKWGNEKIQHGKLACPLCRKEVAITKDGLAELPKNFFVGKLLEVRNSASEMSVEEVRKGIVCDACSKKKTKKQRQRVAAVIYCIECQQNLCNNCHGNHKKARFQTQHNVVDLKEQQRMEESLFRGIKFPESPCPKHPGKGQEVYCSDCKLVLCVMCYIADHSKHQCSDVKQVADEMTRKMVSDVDGLSGKVAECKELLSELEQQSKEFAENANKVEKEIEPKAEELKRLIEDYKTKLLKDLNSARTQQEKKLECVRDELEGRLMMMESFKNYWEELRTKGTDCDVARTASSLHDRAQELMKFDARKEIQLESLKVDVKFESTATDSAEITNLFGELLVNENKPEKPAAVSAVQDVEREDLEETSTSTTKNVSRWLQWADVIWSAWTDTYDSGNVSTQPERTVSQTLPSSFKQFGTIAGNGAAVSGLTSLGDEVFVIRAGSTSIDVYSVSSLQLVRRLPLGWDQTSVADQNSLAACGVNNCIYVSGNIGTDKIYRVELRGSGKVSSWLVGSKTFGLSLSTDSNLLVACGLANKIKIYTTRGKLLKEITLQRDIVGPMNVIQLSSNTFGVTYADISDISSPCFSVVDLNGRVVRSYNGSQDPTVGQLDFPSGISLYQPDALFMADCNNNRILVLNLTTFSAVPLAVEGALTLRCPYCIHYDKSRDQLYIGEFDGQFRVVVFQK